MGESLAPFLNGLPYAKGGSLRESLLLSTFALFAGYLLDLLFADPDFRFHPVRIMGRAIAYGERIANRGNDRARFVKGALLVLTLLVVTFAFFSGVRSTGEVLLRSMSPVGHLLSFVFDASFIFLFLANQGLVREGREVFAALDRSLEEGRQRLSRIVGRDTGKLQEQQVRIAVFESLSENLSDGVVAPLFYLSIAGIPGMALYKMVNTLDSMIGYKNERYLHFGRFAARLDDAANWIPARLTALLLVIVSGRFRAFRTIVRDGSNHSSPNAGYPEAALAGILDCRFGGPNYYGGRLVEKPFIGDNARVIGSGEIGYVIRLNQRVALFSVGLIAMAYGIVLLS